MNKKITTDAYIIEGWLSDYSIKNVITILKNDSCKNIFVTGGPIEKGSYLLPFSTYAELGSRTLTALSIDEKRIIEIPANETTVDRTYTSARALRSWIDSTHYSFKNLTLISESVHTRRSFILFKKALGNTFTLGSIAVEPAEFKEKEWWKYSSGVRAVTDETIAYIYAELFLSFNKKSLQK